MTKKRILVTGSSRGIGCAISQKLLAQGFEVIGLSRNFDDCPIKDPFFHPMTVDLGQLDQLANLLKDLVQWTFPVHGVVSNVGKGSFKNLEQFSYEEIEFLMSLNFLSHVYLTKAFLPQLKTIGEGDIIFIGSEGALQGRRLGTLYCASKFALRGFAQALRDECSTSGIRVSLINPGMVQSAFYDTSTFEPGNSPDEHLLPNDVAEMVAIILQARKGMVFDEVNITPQKRRISHKIPVKVEMPSAAP